MINLLHTGKNSKYDISYTIHKCPKSLVKDIYFVLMNELEKYYIDKTKYKTIYDFIECNVLIVPTWQEARVSLLEKKISTELDRLFVNFQTWNSYMLKNINTNNYLFNASCPHTGKCLYGEPSGHTYNELKGLSTLLKYDNEKIGCCGMVYHPKFQDRGYPITLFTTLDLNTLIKILTMD